MNISQELVEIISQTLGTEKEEITPKSHFYNDLNSTKGELANIIMKAQKKLKITLDEKVVNQVETVFDLIKLFEENTDEI